MKNDSFFNWLIIIVALLLSIGMFSKSLAYWWVPYLVSLVALARYTDFLESKERDEAVVSFPTKKWSDKLVPVEEDEWFHNDIPQISNTWFYMDDSFISFIKLFNVNN